MLGGLLRHEVLRLDLYQRGPGRFNAVDAWAIDPDLTVRAVELRFKGVKILTVFKGLGFRV